MRSFTRMLALSGLAGLLAALAMAIPAQAAGVKAACVLDGTVKFNPDIQLVGGKNSYTFDGMIVCLGVEKLTNPSAVQLGVRSVGEYKNIVCGTGKLTGTSFEITSQTTLLGTPKTDWAGLAAAGKLKYTIEAIAGAGLLYWHDPSVSKLPPGLTPKLLPDPKPNSKPGGTLGGLIVGSPNRTKTGSANPGPQPCIKSAQGAGILMIDTENIPF